MLAKSLEGEMCVFVIVCVFVCGFRRYALKREEHVRYFSVSF